MEFIYPFQPPALLHDVIDQSLIDESNKMCDGLVPEGTRNYAISIDHPIHNLQAQIYKIFIIWNKAQKQRIHQPSPSYHMYLSPPLPLTLPPL